MAHAHTEVIHVEQHFSSGDLVRDIVIGMADGLTVPFALAAGLTGAVSVTKLIVLAGLAEIAAGSIAMGLGGYLAAKGDAQHYESEREREEREIAERLARLTARERQVCELVASGLLNKQIAFELGTSEKTIKVHRGRVMHKLEVHSVAALVRLLAHVPKPPPPF